MKKSRKKKEEEIQSSRYGELATCVVIIFKHRLIFPLIMSSLFYDMIVTVSGSVSYTHLTLPTKRIV